MRKPDNFLPPGAQRDLSLRIGRADLREGEFILELIVKKNK
jgi:hypothetical protein